MTESYDEILDDLIDAAEDDLELIYDEPEELKEDNFSLFQVALIGVGGFLLLELTKELNRIGKKHKATINPTPANKNQLKKVTDYLSKNVLPINEMNQVKRLLSQSNVGKSNKLKLLSTYLGMTPKVAKQHTKALQKLITEGAGVNKVVAEMQRRSTNQINKRRKLQRHVEKKRIQELARRGAIMQLKQQRKIADAPVYKRWDSTLDTKTSDFCNGMHGEVRELNGTFDGYQAPPVPTHYCRSVLEYFQIIDGKEVVIDV
ncbi:phage minor head protein [Endozoicomonas sp. ALB032]|uniref:phage minor head protein n=1 Tax=Endozoicomonas sp. ALB032 TaxID=3403082 RepID=UPI003BB49BDB